MPLQFSESQRSGGSINFSANSRATVTTPGLREASQAEAVAGAILGRYMSPLRVAQYLAGGALALSLTSLTINTGSAIPTSGSVVDIAGSIHLTVTNPTLAVTFPTFDAGVTSYLTGNSIKVTYTSAATSMGAALAVQVMNTPTTPNTGALIGINAGVLNRINNCDASAFVAYVAGTSDVTNSAGRGVFVVGRRVIGKGTSSVRLLEIVNESDGDGVGPYSLGDTLPTADNPHAAIYIWNLYANNAPKKGVAVTSAVDYGVQVGIPVSEGAPANHVITPTYPYSFYDNNGVHRFYITSGGALNLVATGAGHVISAAQTAVVVVRNTTTNASTISQVDTTTASFAALHGYYDAGTIKWYVGKETDNALILFDAVLNRRVMWSASNTGVVSFGVSTTASGLLDIYGSTSGVISLSPQAAAGTYNWNWPTTAGTAGQPLLSGGGGLTAMSFGTVGPTGGGTGFASYAVGDLLYADTTTSLAKLADVATGNALISGGIGAAPSWGKIGISTHVSGLGTGVATALAVNVGSAGAFVTFNGALGTPSSGTVTNLTGTASININGTVGATTPAAGTFTTLVANTSLKASLILPPSNGTAAIQITKADGTTEVLAVDTTNSTLIAANGAAAGFSIRRTSDAAAAPVLAISGNYTQLYSSDGTPGAIGTVFFAGGNASDPTSYYSNTTHTFRSQNLGTTFATLNATAFNVSSGRVYQVAGTQVVGPRDTGWTAMTGTPDESTSYATGSVTLPQLAGRVMALQTALTTHGLIGA